VSLPTHPLAYLPHARVVGANSIAEAASLIRATVNPAAHVLSSIHPTDAHAICYMLRDGDEWPRIRKSCLPEIRDKGDDVVLPWTFIDLDLEKNASGDRVSWTPDSLESWWDCLADLAAADWWPARDWYCAYTTRGGARLVYRWESPLSPEQWELSTAALIVEVRQGLSGIGLWADPRCTDWTRLFRLPSVVRDGAQTANEWWHSVEFQTDKITALLQMTAVTVSPSYPLSIQPLDVKRLSLSLPPEDEAAGLLEYWDSTKAKMVESDFSRNSRKVLRGQPYFSALFEGVPLAEKGSRDDTLFRTLGSIIAYLHGQFGTTPKHVYGLSLRLVSTFLADSGTPDWRTSAWRKVCHIWAIEDAKARSKEDERRNEVHRTQGLQAGMALGMSEWADVDGLGVDPDSGKLLTEGTITVQRHLICCLNSGREFYILGPDGRYQTMPLGSGALIPRLRAMFPEDVLPTRSHSPTGVRDFTATDLVNAYGTVVQSVEYCATANRVGGTIADMDTPDARLVLCPFARRTDLEPLYSPDVDEWMQKLFGQHYEDATRWLAYALAWDEGPICALSLTAPTGVGKTLLAEGLKECLTVPAASDFGDLVGDWQYDLVRSPFVFADEGLSSSNYRQHHPADVFRRIIGRGDLRASRKNLSPAKVKVDLRVLFTANNYSVIRALVGGREMTPEDRDAVAIRLKHLNLDASAGLWLQQNGGRQFTQGWISDGYSSRYVVAQHLLYLHSQRDTMGKDPRLLVEGNLDPAVIDELRLHSGQTDRIVQAILAIIHSPPNSRGFGRTVIQRGMAYVVPSDIQTHLESQGIRTLRVGAIRDALRNLVPVQCIREGEKDPQPIMIEGDRTRRYPIDLNFLIKCASEYGWEADRLHAILEGKDADFGLRGAAPLNRDAIPVGRRREALKTPYIHGANGLNIG